MSSGEKPPANAQPNANAQRQANAQPNAKEENAWWQGFKRNANSPQGNGSKGVPGNANGSKGGPGNANANGFKGVQGTPNGVQGLVKGVQGNTSQENANGGKRAAAKYTKTDKYVVVDNRKHVVYQGARGGSYIKKNDVFRYMRD